MAPRAAWRLEALGFSEVFVYRAGKSDWSAAGLPTDGTVTEPRAGQVMHAVATCSPSDLIAELSEERVVVNEGGVILGRVRAAQLTGESGVRVDEVMTAGPTTVRANEPLEALVSRMTDRNVPAILVSDPDGVLLGALERDDAERALGARGAEAP